MSVTIRDNVDQHRYEALVDDQVAGFSDYRLREGRITFTHTEVDDAYEGQGIGSQLASAVLDAAREAGLDVYPSCPFIADHIKRHPDRYLDLVPERVRAKYGVV
ncbi:GNAT family N-acetyltransferase [Nocardioides sp. GXQ0305]|uniref:GNAT family N-acetyltransferase n=1 Tax=Nocardioides sp. GXQ0305 TaxID=3423912 RepID=UPI003D7EA97F